MYRAGVSLRVVEHTLHKERSDQISHDWIQFLEDHGIIPILIPNTYTDIFSFVDNFRINLLLLSSGNNIGPLRIKENNFNISDVSVERDETERKLIDYALKNKIPILGVCRGMQMLNIYFGGQLERDLSPFYSEKKAHVTEKHMLRIENKSLQGILKSNHFFTNSYHNQAVSLKGIAKELKSFATADDIIVEGFYHPKHHVIGIQWHPERTQPSSRFDELILQAWCDFSKYEQLFLNQSG